MVGLIIQKGLTNGVIYYLSYINNIHTPSEHTQNRKQYDGEIQLQHFHSVPGVEVGYALLYFILFPKIRVQVSFFYLPQVQAFTFV